MHKMENTPRILSIIGSLLDFLGVLGMFAGAFLLKNVFDREFFENIVPPEEMHEVEFIVEIYQFVGNIMIIVGLLLVLIFIINVVNNYRLIKGKYTESQAKIAYTFQLFIGIVLIILNTIAGVVYIISGVQGRNNEPDRIETRPGI